jgi:hypothetical protein
MPTWKYIYAKLSSAVTELTLRHVSKRGTMKICRHLHREMNNEQTGLNRQPEISREARIFAGQNNTTSSPDIIFPGSTLCLVFATS